MTFNDAMEKILQDKKYDELMDRTTGILDTILSEIVDFILEILSRIFGNINITPTSGQFGSWVIGFFAIFTITIILIVIGIIIYFILKKNKYEKSMSEIFKEIKDKNISFEDIVQMSKNFALSGNFREAIRYHYIAILWVLDNKKMINIDETKTNNQLKRELNKNSPQFYNEFSLIVEIFNHVFFGHKEIKKESFDIYIVKFENLIKEVENSEK